MYFTKKIKFYIKFIIQICFLISIFNEIHANNIEKYYEDGKISKYLSGVVSVNDSDYASSYKYLEQLNGLQNYHSQYSLYFQHTLINLEKFPEAFNYAKSLEKKYADNFESNLITGIYYLKNKKYDLAKKSFKKLKIISQNETLSGLVSISLNNWVDLLSVNENEAINLFKNISPRFENITKIQKTFAYCFYKSDLTQEKFKELTENEKTNLSRYSFFYANYLLSKGNKDEAVKTVNLTLKSYPHNLLLNQFKEDLSNEKVNFKNLFDCNKVENVVAEIFYIIASALSTQTLYSLSNFYLNLAKYLNPDFTSFDSLHAENFYMMNNFDNSIKIYKSIKNQGSVYNWHASKRIANIMIIQEKKDEALKFLAKAYNKNLNPSIYQTYDYAVFLKENKKNKESILYYSKILKVIDTRHPLYPSVMDGRGIAHERIGDWNKAEKDLQESLAVSPNQAYVINYLAYSWIEKGINIEKSLTMLEKANKLKKNDGYILDSLGWALFKLKKYKDSKKYLQLAVSIMPTDPIVNDHYGDSLWFNNQSIQARYYWNHVLSLKKTKTELKENVRKKLIYGLKISSL